MPVLINSDLTHISSFTIDVAFCSKIVFKKHVSEIKILTKDSRHVGCLGFCSVFDLSL